MGLAGGLIVGGAVMALADLVHDDLPTSMQALESWRVAFFLVAAPTPIFLFLIAVSRLGHRSEARGGGGGCTSRLPGTTCGLMCASIDGQS